MTASLQICGARDLVADKVAVLHLTGRSQGAHKIWEQGYVKLGI